MSGPRSDTDDELLAEAAGWFARVRNPEADVDAWLAFDAWLAASPAHERAYARVEQAWVEIEGAPQISEKLARPRRPVVSRRGWLIAGGAIAASAAAAVYLAPIIGRPDGPPTTYVAAPGAPRQVRLADGTLVQLRPGSTLTVRLGRRARQVVMADAEAVFDVAHDAKRPFLIAAGDTSVRVVGTRFNIRHRAGEVLVSVNRGVVEVQPDKAAAPTRVVAGQRFRHVEGAPGAFVEPAEPDADFAWIDRRLVYRSARLGAIAEDLSRDLGVPVRVADETTGGLVFTGVLTLDSPDTAVQRLSGLAGVRVHKDARGYLLTGE